MEVPTDRDQFLQWLRSELPKLLREDPAFYAEVVGTLTTSLASKAEFTRLLEEIRQLREDFLRHVETTEQRFTSVDRRLDRIEVSLEEHKGILSEHTEILKKHSEILKKHSDTLDEHTKILKKHSDTLNEHTEILQKHSDTLERHTEILEKHSQALAEHGRQLRRLEFGVGSLGGRLGVRLEELVRRVIEDFSGIGPLRAERLVLVDEAGEFYGVPGAHVEFDALVQDGRCFLVEVKSHADAQDVYAFYKKWSFAKPRLKRDAEPVLVASTAHPRAVETAERLGIRLLAVLRQTPAEE